MERYTRNISGVDVLFIRIGNILGYIFNLNGKEYGNTTSINGKKTIEVDKDLSESEIKKKITSIFFDLEINAEETINKNRL